MKFISILPLLFPLLTYAIEYEFDGGQITALGGVTYQSAGLGYLDQKYTFAASASALEFTKYKIKNNSFEQSNSPMNFKPLYVGSAMSTRYGGWSLLVINQSQDYRAQFGESNGGDTIDSDMSLEIQSITALVSAGYRIHENWSLGWGLVLSQYQLESNKQTYSSIGGTNTFEVENLQQQSTRGGLHMSALFSLEDFVLGLKILPPQFTIAKAGKNRLRNLNATTDNFTDEIEKKSLSSLHDWNMEVGLRFGRKGFSYVLSDDYTTNGLHNLKFGFEYVGGWGTIASGATYSHFEKQKNSSVTVGFIKDHQNFKWGVGPYYRNQYNSEPGAFNSSSFGVLYSSEIRY